MSDGVVREEVRLQIEPSAPPSRPPHWPGEPEDPFRDPPDPRRPDEDPVETSKNGKSPFDKGATEEGVGPVDAARKKELRDVADGGLGRNAAAAEALDELGRVPLPRNPLPEPIGEAARYAALAAAVYAAKKYVSNELKTSNSELKSAKQNLIDNFKGVEPLVFDLDGDGIDLLSAEESLVSFDWDDDGLFEKTAWIGSDDGMLAIDLGLDGVINQAAELTFADSGMAGLTDLDRLRGYDTNHNGVLDAGDVQFADFRLWRDLNQNGQSEAGELLSLTDAGITSVELTGTPVSPPAGKEIYWFDTNGDGIATEDELYQDEATAPAGAIVGELRDGALVFHQSSAASVSGSIATYTVSLGFDADGARLDVDGNEAVLTYQDGRTLSYQLANSDSGVTIDISQGSQRGAFGGLGNDTLTAGGRVTNAQLLGGDGDDVLIGGSGDDLLIGGMGADHLLAGDGDDTLMIDGDDLTAGIDAGDGDDVVYIDGDDGVTLNLAAIHAETAYGTDEDDVLSAAGVTQDAGLYGGDGDDILEGSDFDDVIAGGEGADQISGGSGDDILYIDASDTLISGGDGQDIAFVSTAEAMILDITAHSIELIFGNEGDDQFTATGAANVDMDGGGGNDILSGGDGNDLFMGGTGDDSITGGSGFDRAGYAGKISDYSIVQAGTGYIVTDLNAADGDDGTDYLEGIERLLFSDGTAHLVGDNSAPSLTDDVWKARNASGGVSLTEAGLLANDSDKDGDRSMSLAFPL